MAAPLAVGTICRNQLRDGVGGEQPHCPFARSTTGAGRARARPIRSSDCLCSKLNATGAALRTRVLTVWTNPPWTNLPTIIGTTLDAPH